MVPPKGAAESSPNYDNEMKDIEATDLASLLACMKSMKDDLHNNIKNLVDRIDNMEVRMADAGSDSIAPKQSARVAGSRGKTFTKVKLTLTYDSQAGTQTVEDFVTKANREWEVEMMSITQPPPEIYRIREYGKCLRGEAHFWYYTKYDSFQSFDDFIKELVGHCHVNITGQKHVTQLDHIEYNPDRYEAYLEELYSWYAKAVQIGLPGAHNLLYCTLPQRWHTEYGNQSPNSMAEFAEFVTACHRREQEKAKQRRRFNSNSIRTADSEGKNSYKADKPNYRRDSKPKNGKFNQPRNVHAHALTASEKKKPESEDPPKDTSPKGSCSHVRTQDNTESTLCLTRLKVHDEEVTALLNGGANISFISRQAVEKLRLKTQMVSPPSQISTMQRTH